MEVFRLTAPGPGSYRIEGFVLLQKRPEPSRFAPEIRNLTIRASGDDDLVWSARLQFTTSRAARVEATRAREATVSLLTRRFMRDRRPSRHDCIISFSPICRLRAVTKRSSRRQIPSGETVTERLTFSTAKVEGPPAGKSRPD